MVLPLPARPISLTVGRPTITAAVLYKYRYPPVNHFTGQVSMPTGWQPDDPEVWPLNSLKQDADGPIAEALFSNHNADMLLECDSPSLVGRTDPTRGVAQKIEAVAPLILEGKKLSFDTSVLVGPGNTIITSNKQTQDVDHAIANGSNAMSVGPVTIATGVKFTVPTGSRWVVI